MGLTPLLYYGLSFFCSIPPYSNVISFLSEMRLIYCLFCYASLSALKWCIACKKWRFSRNFYVFRMIATLTNPFYIASERVGALKGLTPVISWIEWHKMFVWTGVQSWRDPHFSLTSEFLKNFLGVIELQ